MSDLVLMPVRFAVLALVFAAVASFSDWPRHRSVPEGMGVVSLSFSHGADRRAACRPATEEELAKMPPNMRRTEICPRERPGDVFDWEGRKTVEINPADHRVIDFRVDGGGFVFH